MTNLSEWNPFGTRSVLWGDLFDRMMTPVAGESAGIARWNPRVNVRETPESYLFSAEAPGMRAEDIHIDVTKEGLTISGEKRQEKKEEKDQWHLTERSYGSFSRSFTFPVPVDADHVEATTKDGVLSIKVMKSKEVAPRKIAVKSL